MVMCGAGIDGWDGCGGLLEGGRVVVVVDPVVDRIGKERGVVGLVIVVVSTWGG